MSLSRPIPKRDTSEQRLECYHPALRIEIVGLKFFPLQKRADGKETTPLDFQNSHPISPRPSALSRNFPLQHYNNRTFSSVTTERQSRRFD